MGGGIAIGPMHRLAATQPYTTALDPAQEDAFQHWVVANKIPWRDEPKADYDMRGFWKAQISGDPQAVQAGNKHFPDTWKTPYHQSFSNESVYATPEAPAWKGKQLVSPQGKVVFEEK